MPQTGSRAQGVLPALQEGQESGQTGSRYAKQCQRTQFPSVRCCSQEGTTIAIVGETRVHGIPCEFQVAAADPSVPELQYLAEDKLCHCHVQLNEHQEALEFCSAAIRRHEEPRILCDRAEAYIGLDMLDEAQADYSKV